MIAHAHDAAWFNSAPLPPLSAWEKAETCTSRWCVLCQEYRDQDPAAPVPCTTTDRHGDECRTLTSELCIDCGCGVCIRCALPCFECGQPLHDHCREEHAKSSGHRVDGPKGLPPVAELYTGSLIESLLELGGAR